MWVPRTLVEAAPEVFEGLGLCDKVLYEEDLPV